MLQPAPTRMCAEGRQLWGYGGWLYAADDNARQSNSGIVCGHMHELNW